MGGVLKNALQHGERDFDYRPEDFERIRRLLYQHTGISLNDSKSQMVYSRLARRLRALGYQRFRDYLGDLSPGNEEWQAFQNALTTNLTAFFREPHHFETLRQIAAEHKGRERFRVWCAASSTGEEPYSIAMTLIEALGSFTPNAEVIASDIDTHVLQHASDGIYSLSRLESVSTAQKRAFFLRGKGKQEGMARVRPELRDLISFVQINLLSPGWPVQGPFDVIFCRNVLIYFDKPTQLQVVNRFAPLLRPGGTLMIGHSENLFHLSAAFENCGRTTYRLRDQKGAAS